MYLHKFSLFCSYMDTVQNIKLRIFLIMDDQMSHPYILNHISLFNSDHIFVSYHF